MAASRDDQVLPVVLARQAKGNPDRTAVEFVDGPTLSYGALDDLARRWAAGLRRIGLEAGDRVAEMLMPCEDAYGAWLGVGWLKAMDTAINTEYRKQTLEYIFTNSGAKVAVVDARWIPRIAEIAGSLSGLETVVVTGDASDMPSIGVPTMTAAELLDGVDPIGTDDPPQPHDICTISYTSGTTGRSKGVLMPWAQMWASALGCFPGADMGSDEAFYSPFPMYHGSGRCGLVIMARCGGKVVVRDRFSGSQFWDDIRTYGCTRLALMGAMATFLWNEPATEHDRDNPARQAVMFPVVPYYREFEERFGLTLNSLYSMTEIGPVIQAPTIEVPASCGRAATGYQVRVVDGDDYEVAPGEIGELIVRTDEPWMMNAGYFNMPEATAAAWHNGWFHTGDAFRIDEEGRYYFVDRIKDAIRRRAENISSFEVEAHVNAHPEVAESAAIAAPSEWGEDEVMVVVVRNPGSELTPDDLIDFLAEEMPRFMVPRYIRWADSLPKTDATLRVRKVELRQEGVTADTWDREAAGKKITL